MGQTNSRNRITPQDRAILDLKLQRDKIKQYQKKIQTVLNREQEIAKECLQRGDKDRALLALRRRKYQEGLLTKTDKELEILEGLTSQIEFALVEKDILEGLRQGNAVLKNIQKEMSLESVEKLMEENADAIAYQKEVSEMLAGHMSNADEDEVEDELEAMEREVLAERAAITPSVQMPSVPNKEPETTPEEDRVAQEKARRKARAEKRRVEAQAQPEPEPMLA